jgi:uncharacterized membrane protein YsdA (DUF1294 family)
MKITKNSILMSLMALFIVCIFFAISRHKLPNWIPLYYLAMGIITYIIYAIDKSKAINNQYRISESTLHILSLLGGWLGAIIAQQYIRHKNKKIIFQFIFWITVFLNIFFILRFAK